MSIKRRICAVVVVIAGLTVAGRACSIGMLQSGAAATRRRCGTKCEEGPGISFGDLTFYADGDTSPSLSLPTQLIFAQPDQAGLTPFSFGFIPWLTPVSPLPAAGMTLWNAGSPPDSDFAGIRQQVYSFIDLYSPHQTGNSKNGVRLQRPISDPGIYGLSLNAQWAGSGVIGVGFEWDLPQDSYVVAYGQSRGQVFRAPFLLEPRVVLADLDSLFPDHPCVPGGSNCSPPGKPNNRLQLKSKGLLSPELNDGRLSPELDNSRYRH